MVMQQAGTGWAVVYNMIYDKGHVGGRCVGWSGLDIIALALYPALIPPSRDVPKSKVDHQLLTCSPHSRAASLLV